MTTLGIILLHILAMFQPEPIIDTGRGRIAAVEFTDSATLLRLHATVASDTLWLGSSGVYLSDESDARYPLRHVASDGSSLLLTFAPLPATTRIFDVIGDDAHRWIGVHSRVRSLRLPTAHPKYDADAKIADFIEEIIHRYSVETLLRDDTLQARVRPRLPLLRDYVVWKWKLSPHEAFVFARNHQRYAETSVPTAGTRTAHAMGGTTGQRTLDEIPAAPKPRQRLMKRLLGKKSSEAPPSAAVRPRKPKPLSRFEQKMLQEMRSK